MKANANDKTQQKPTLVILGKVEKDIIKAFAERIGSKSKSAALRQLIRDWNRQQQEQEQAS